MRDRVGKGLKLLVRGLKLGRALPDALFKLLVQLSDLVLGPLALFGHLIESSGKHAHLAMSLYLNPVLQNSLADYIRALCQLLYRPDNSPDGEK